MLPPCRIGRPGRVARRGNDGGTYWAERLGEPEVVAPLALEVSGPYVGGFFTGLLFAAVVLLALAAVGPFPEGITGVVLGVVVCVGGLLFGMFGTRRAMASRWIEATGAPPTGMLLGLVGDHLVIWRWPRRRDRGSVRLLDVPLTEVSLRRRSPYSGHLEIELSDGPKLFVQHNMGPHERKNIDLIVSRHSAAGQSSLR